MPSTRTREDLCALLCGLDGRGYGSYRDCAGEWGEPGFTLCIDHVQADPYAPASRLRARVPAAVAALPAALLRDPVRRLAVADFLARAFAKAVSVNCTGRRGSLTGGDLKIDAGGQQVIERTAVNIAADGAVEARFTINLPAHGRRVAGHEASRLLCGELPRVVADSLRYSALPLAELHRLVACVEDQIAMRAQLDRMGLVAFVADGSVLPRCSGVADGPMPGDLALPFRSPESLRVTIDTPNSGQLSGMGVPRGVTLICGGGFHGKSTLLAALENGVYDHVPGDGRDRVVSAPGTVKIRAEDGRSVAQVDISGFIRDLPDGQTTGCFSCVDASGSTSQAASISEYLEIGATCLLMDEDTCATNFMIRDARMQALIAPEGEPIIPFLDRVRDLYDVHGVSTVLVTGGVGDYFEMADTVLVMEKWEPRDDTAVALGIAAASGPARDRSDLPPLSTPRVRSLLPGSVDPRKGRCPVKVAVRGKDRLVLGGSEIDLTAVGQLVDTSQIRAVGWLLAWLGREARENPAPLAELLERAEMFIDDHGLDILTGRLEPDLARPRRFETAAALNRLRGARFAQEERQ